MPRLLVIRDKDRFIRGKAVGSGPKKIFRDITKKFRGVFTSKAARKIFTSGKTGVVKFAKSLLPLLGPVLKTLIDKGIPALTDTILQSIGQKGSQQFGAALRKILVPTTKFLGELGKKQIDIQIKNLQKKKTTGELNAPAIGRVTPVIIPAILEGAPTPSPSIPSKGRIELTPDLKRQVRAILKKRRLKLGAGLLTMN